MPSRWNCSTTPVPAPSSGPTVAASPPAPGRAALPNSTRPIPGAGIRTSGEAACVRIERSMLDRPADLVGVMAHELAHQRLLGEGRAHQHDFDNELLTDLTALYFGFGVFLANNPRKSTGELSNWPDTKLRAGIPVGTDDRLCPGPHRLVSRREPSRLGQTLALGSLVRFSSKVCGFSRRRRIPLMCRCDCGNDWSGLLGQGHDGPFLL